MILIFRNILIVTIVLAIMANLLAWYDNRKGGKGK